MVKNHSSYTKNNQKGAVAPILVLLFLLVLIPIGALAIDLAFLYVARNELQNAADSGALAGTRSLYITGGTAINQDANQIAYDTAKLNNSFGSSVEINWVSPQNSSPSTPSADWYDIERGHWSFGRGNVLDKGFTPNDSLTVVQTWAFSDAELDDNVNFINAVRVVARREATPVSAFFARLFNFENFKLSAESVAYLGFAGSLDPQGVDLPFAVCKQSIVKNPTEENPDSELECNIGRRINSGNNVTSSNTGAWTNFDQTQPSCVTGNSSDLTDFFDNCGGYVNDNLNLCSPGNEGTVYYGIDVGTIGGNLSDVFKPTNPNNTKSSLWDYWIALGNLDPEDPKSLQNSTDNDGKPTKSWPLKLLVIDCPNNQVPNCTPILGVVELDLIWLVESANLQGGNAYDEAPWEMDNWSSDNPDGQIRWNSFVTHFNLKNADGSPAPFDDQSIYFKPTCSYAEPSGFSGGENFGVLAKIPVIVK